MSGLQVADTCHLGHLVHRDGKSEAGQNAGLIILCEKCNYKMAMVFRDVHAGSTCATLLSLHI